MPYQYILANLLAEADGALGVVFVDDEGETVDVAVRGASRVDLRVTGAYLGIYMKRVVSLARETDLGRPRLLYVQRHGLTILASALTGGYALAVVHDTGRGIGKSSFSLMRAARDLERTVLREIE